MSDRKIIATAVVVIGWAAVVVAMVVYAADSEPLDIPLSASAITITYDANQGSVPLADIQVCTKPSFAEWQVVWQTARKELDTDPNTGWKYDPATMSIQALSERMDAVEARIKALEERVIILPLEADTYIEMDEDWNDEWTCELTDFKTDKDGVIDEALYSDMLRRLENEWEDAWIE